MPKIHIIIDGNNNVYRADMTTNLYTTKGVRTSGIKGLLSIIQATTTEMKSKFKLPIGKIVVTWDFGHSELRKSILPTYKINRKQNETEESKAQKEKIFEQIDILHQNLESFGIYTIKKRGWEGDDLAYLTCKKLRKLYPKDGIIVVSTDEDYHQFLLLGNTAIYSPTKKILYTQKNYKELCGIEYTQFLDYKVLKGDTSDSIDGISGIGDKSAKELLNKYISLDTIYASNPIKTELSKSKRYSKLLTEEALFTIARNRQLIDISKVDFSSIEKSIEEYLLSDISVNKKVAFEFLQQYEIHSIATEFTTFLNNLK